MLSPEQSTGRSAAAERAAVWSAAGAVLALQLSDGTEVIPSAEEIFAAEFRGQCHFGDLAVATGPGAALPHLAISRHPLKLIVRIGSLAGTADGQIDCRIYASREGLETEIPDALQRRADHLILGNTWFPFARDALPEIRELFRACEIEKPGAISLRQYLALVRQQQTCPFIEDRCGDVTRAGHSTVPVSLAPLNGFRGALYPCQITGYGWLTSLAEEGLGGILGDEMGIGKTIQVIGLMLAEKAAGQGPSLVIAPATILENWRRELARFAPGLTVLVHQGGGRTGRPDGLAGYDVVITSYDTLIRDIILLCTHAWNLVVLDEAQNIKNPLARRTLAAGQLPRRVSIAVTGTPVENRLSDLWSIMNFAVPDLLGPLDLFEQTYGNDREGGKLLEPLVSPLILRRKLADVAADLPPRIDIPQVLRLDASLAAAYETIRQETAEKYQDGYGLVSLGRLRMFCTHPFLVGAATGDPAAASPKYTRLLEILEEVFQRNEKALIYTGYRGMTDLFMHDLPLRFRGIHLDWIDGRTDIGERQLKIDQFTQFAGPGAMILGPRAAGAGLNITAACHVIHYNPEWNPAVEDQASARAYRRGQTRPVTIHRLVFADTVEEVMADRLDEKRSLAGAAVVGTTGDTADLEDIRRALAVSPVKRSG